MLGSPPSEIDCFITRWEESGAAERANYQMFLSELCDIIGVPRPVPTAPDIAKNTYVFDRAVTRKNPDGSSAPNFIDLYKAGAFVLETKQGVTAADPDPLAATAFPTKTGHGKRGTAAFDRALERAFHQARSYITSLPVADGRPPFLIVCDVGHSIDLYAEFSGTGGHYERFPDPANHRITLPDLRREEIRALLRSVWTDPHSLDPAKHAAAVTRDIAARLAKLAKSLETDGHDPQVIASFLQRCLFTMFAEDIGLLPADAFRDLLTRIKDTPQGFPVLASGLWKEMATGATFSALLFKEISHFNGGLFEDTTALPLSKAQLAMLIDAAATDWSAVEPSIFGTLLTRALDPRERHKLGAHYTPRSYVDRLVRPTIIDPLRQEWDSVRIAAATLHREADAAEIQADEKSAAAQSLLSSGKSAAAKEAGAAATSLLAVAKKKDAEALKLVTAFHRHLCEIHILDPACGTANFLYATLEHMKRLEAEVLELITACGGDATFEMKGTKVRPEQFLGLEISPNAVAIAQLVLWIGYFQWQRKTTGKADTGDRPLLPKAQTIRQQDAVLAYDRKVPRRDPATGEILTIWDGHTTKTHLVTGKEVPDESARTVLFDYTHPKQAEWPKADYIVGNPPFIGTKRMIDALGSGYTESLRKAWKGKVPESADFVMFWWRKAAEQVAEGRCKRFGFITTNSIHQTFNRRVIEPFLADEKKPLHLAYAIPDHPWVDSADGAAVRISMTVAAPGKAAGVLEKVTAEQTREDGENDVSLIRSGGLIAPNLQIGADLSSALSLLANDKIAGMGVALHGAGFILLPEEAKTLRTSGARVIKAYLGGSDLLRNPRERYLIDFSFMTEDEALKSNPAAYQHVRNHVKPERDQNKRDTLKINWWKFGWERPVLRNALTGLSRYIGTTETSKHRIFQFIPSASLADHKILCIASGDAYILSVLSSATHVIWSFATGGRLGVGNDSVYNKTRCFDPFPFPDLPEGELKRRIRELGERLDAHRKAQQAAHPELTLTGIYNVLEKLRAGEALNAKEKIIHDQGLVTILKQIHDDLDAAVLEAYGWIGDITDGRMGEPLADVLARGGPEGEALEQELLTRLVALNHARAAEESRGQIRYLRPDYQNPAAAQAPPEELGMSLPVTPKHRSTETPAPSAWPEKLPEQVALIRQYIGNHDNKVVAPYDAESVSSHFGKKSKKRTEQIEGILETLKGLGML
jgi:hypothetical protein